MFLRSGSAVGLPRRVFGVAVGNTRSIAIMPIRARLNLRLLRKTNVKLTEHMTRRQCHLSQIRRIPRTQNNPSVIRFVFQFIYDFRQLINTLARIIRLGIYVLRAKMSPLEAIDRSQIPLFTVRKADAVEVFAGAISVPDFYPGRREGDRGGGARNEPEEFGDNGAEEDAFGR